METTEPQAELCVVCKRQVTEGVVVAFGIAAQVHQTCHGAANSALDALGIKFEADFDRETAALRVIRGLKPPSLN